MHAVGGGGAGAIIAQRDLSDGTKVFVSDLEPKQYNVQATSNLTAGNPGAWPSWVTWMNQNKKKSADNPGGLPWFDDSTATKLKDRFDVSTVDTKQVLRYRVSGSAGNTVSTFLPQLPGKATLRLYPGKGGSLNGSGYGTGEDGEDTRVMYIYEGKTPIEGLLAKGGKGGSGKIDSKITYSLVGGEPTDFDLSSLVSINSKKSGFIDVIEAAEKYEQMKSKVPANAGDSGNGETQFVYDTDGTLYFEYNENAGYTQSYRRVNSQWKGITEYITQNYFKRPYFTTTTNCSLKNITSPIVVSREGFCDLDNNSITPSTMTYICAVGKIPLAAANNLVAASDPGKTGSWRRYKVVLQYTFNAAEKKMTFGAANIEGNDLAYNPTNAKFFDCKMDTNFMTISCKTVVNSGKIYSCAKKNGTGYCSNGLKAKSRSENSNTYSSSSNATKAKCPASDGGDGAVVILW